MLLLMLTLSPADVYIISDEAVGFAFDFARVIDRQRAHIRHAMPTRRCCHDFLCPFAAAISTLPLTAIFADTIFRHASPCFFRVLRHDTPIDATLIFRC